MLGLAVIVAVVAVGASLQLERSQPPVYGDLTVQQSAELIKAKPELFILDVRTREEYDAGHLKGAVLVPVTELEGRLGELPRDREMLVYCRTGNRSRTALEILRAGGFSKLYHIKDGITAWTQAGYTVE
jgi:rhodanese-related sulfurtransferase